MHTLNRRSPTGGLAYGILVKALIGLPLWDLKYFPSNLLPFDNVTLKSSEVTHKITPNAAQFSNKITTILDHILS